MQPFPEFKQYKDANIAISKTDVKKPNTPTYAHRCWMNITVDKLQALGSVPFMFDCLIDGARYVWCAPAVVLVEAFDVYRLHRADKQGAPYALYLDYKRGHIYNSPYQSDTQVICQLSPVINGTVYQQILKSL
ncbi:MAG: hypothetical protein Q4F35_06265 [Akkermansia sp.]|nr:hypothetical protein [Akkermansia sp.]